MPARSSTLPASPRVSASRRRRTVSRSVDFPSMAAACGYAAAARVGSLDELGRALTSAEPGPRFLHVPIAPGVPADLPRPSVRPHEVAARLRAHLEAQP